MTITGFKTASLGWTFRDVLDRLLVIASQPVKEGLLNHGHGPGDNHSTSSIYSKALVEISCQVVSSIVSELASQTSSSVSGSDSEAMHTLGGRILQMTPNRFSRTSNSRPWNTGNGSPDAICFSVDRSGIFIVGCCVYGGMGSYEYELELLDDHGAAAADKEPAGGGQSSASQRWSSLETTRGSYSSDDCVGDIAEIKFERAVAVRSGHYVTQFFSLLFTGLHS